MNEVHDVLVKTRNLISDEERWSQGSIGSREAPCLVHACYIAAEPTHGTGSRALKLLESLAPTDNAAKFNDSHTHADVLALLDRGIAATAPQPDVSFLTEPERATA